MLLVEPKQLFWKWSLLVWSPDNLASPLQLLGEERPQRTLMILSPICPEDFLLLV